jgi:aminocarboxymuconate-semialdehyde decarboxylase
VSLAAARHPPTFVDGVPIVDCQVHLHHRTYFEAHVARVEPPWAERTNGGYVFHTTGGAANPIPSSRYEIDREIESCLAQGADVLISSLGAFNVNHLSAARGAELAMQLNEEQSELERRYPGRYYGLALLPMQDAQVAIETLDHAVRTLGLRGVCISTNVNGESIATPARQPIYRRIDELGIPAFLHPTASVMEPMLMRYGHEATIGSMVDSSIAALDLIFSGTLDRHPTLRVVHPHLGGVLPYLAARIDREHAQPSSGTEALRSPPSEYLRRFYTDTVSLNPRALRLAAEVYGSDHVLYASDYPYWPVEAGLALVRDEFSGDALDRILFRNAASLLGLSVGDAMPARG